LQFARAEEVISRTIRIFSAVSFLPAYREKTLWMNFYAGGPKFLIQFRWPPIDAQADAAQKVALALDE